MKIIKKYRKLIIGAVIIFTAILVFPYLYVGSIVVYESTKENINRQKFNSVQWKDSILVFSSDPIRIKMIDDLLAKYKLKGMSKDSILVLLGNPDKTNFFRDSDYVYWLGRERSFISIDSEWLIMNFADDNNVVEYRVTTD